MRRSVLLLSVVSLLLVAFAPAPVERDVSCRIDGSVLHSSAIGVATCLALGGEDFVVDVIVTVQQRGQDGWEDVASERCTGPSTDGVASLRCEVVHVVVGTTSYRALVDLESPRDFEPHELRPTNQGTVHPDALADDECGVNEAIEQNDGTYPDLPWADVCAVTLTHQLTTGGAAQLASITGTVHVAGLLDSRTDTTSWEFELKTEDCRHYVDASDAGMIGTAGVRVVSKCGPLPFEPCTGVNGIIYGDNCRSFPGYEFEEVARFDASAVSFTDTEVIITIPVGELGPHASADLVAGQLVESVFARSTTGLGSSTGGTRLTLDSDFAYSNGRSYVFD